VTVESDREAYIARVIDGAPPLSSGDRDQLAGLLRPFIAAPVGDAAA
jgi:hypothetical protein